MRIFHTDLVRSKSTVVLNVLRTVLADCTRLAAFGVLDKVAKYGLLLFTVLGLDSTLLLLMPACFP